MRGIAPIEERERIHDARIEFDRRGRRLLVPIVLIAALAAGCSDAATPDTAGSAANGESGEPVSGPSTSASEPEPGLPVDTCSLVTDEELLAAFVDGAPDPEQSTGNENQSTCAWGPLEAGLQVIVWPGDEFYSSCELCDDFAAGDEAWIDFSTLQASALVLVGDQTLQVIATGLSVDETEFEDLVKTIASRI